MRTIQFINERYSQLVFVMAAFLLMIGICFWYIGLTVRQHIDNNGNELIFSAQVQVNSMLNDAEGMLHLLEFAVPDNADSAESLQTLNTIIQRFHHWGQLQKPAFVVFCYVDGHYIDGERWVPPADYDPKNRPWYTGAMTKDNGKINYTRPYMSFASGKMIISLTQKLTAPDGKIRGVIGCDILIDEIAEYLQSIRVANRANICLFDQDVRVIISPNPLLLDKLSSEIGDAEAKLAEKMIGAKADTTGRCLSAYSYVGYDGVKRILYSNELSNGWYICSLIPTEHYYAEERTIRIVIGSVGLILMTALSLILIRINKAKDVAEERERSKSVFLAKMSHEIRTPMNTISGMSELILRSGSDLTPQMHNYASNIKHACASLLSIINDILDFSKIESGHFQIASEKYPVSSSVNNLINMIRPRIREKALDFFVFIDSRIPNNLIGDTNRIRQILLNLLSNAAKYTNTGSVTLSIDVFKKEKNKVTLQFTVTDTGTGVKEEEQSRLFDEFVQLDQKGNWGKEGTGLGLAITKNLVQLMGGEISFFSVYGKGSTFTVRVPQEIEYDIPFAVVPEPDSQPLLVYEPRLNYVQPLTETLDNLNVLYRIASDKTKLAKIINQLPYKYILLPAYAHESVAAVLAESITDAKIVLLADSAGIVQGSKVHTLLQPVYSLPIANLLNDVADVYETVEEEELRVQFRAPAARVLVVDDIAINLNVTEGLLLMYEMQMDFAESGAAAVELVQQKDYDIVFMDHMMPGMDGIEASVKIRQLPGEKYQKLPIIALTANAVSGMKDTFLQNGLNDFISKPIEMSKLNAVLLRWLPKEKQEKRQEVRKSAGAAAGAVVPNVMVPGLDVQTGLKMAGGSYARYIQMLNMLQTEAVRKTADVRESAAAGDWKTYTVYVHGLKGLLANLGAAALSQRAAALESAGKENDAAIITQHTESFLAELEQLRKEVAAFLQSVEVER
ncbi:MAG: response regulator [Planctomycetaceae bacterium]|jgi:signal transduction histidine kinase/CheY-like chemotaxis protein/HPt (histidine-containing phosphotransfer) domain-containing protein|nr:response regulator [Planctomycetaceae bacterium]